MSEDLKGNTNFVFLKNLQDELVVPRTNLAAVDMTAANGLAVVGSTLYVNLATDSDIEYGTTGSIVDAAALKTALDTKQGNLEAGTGVEIVAGETASTISVPITDVETLIDGTTATKVVDVAALRGALTAGQAVDVTSAPDGVTGDYLGSFTVTGGSLGFAAFPKYAKNMNYLFMATIVPTTAGTVTPSANCKWIDTGDRAARSVVAGVPVKLAVTFTSSANTCPASFALSGTGAVAVSYCRQYEVTACSAEAVNYIASLSNPDAFADYYLVKADMVQPWTYIIDMGTSPAVTIAAGLRYKLNATTGTHTLTVDTCPAGYDGRDAIIRITLGGNGVVQAAAPLQLGAALVPYAINNCVVKFRDGEAVLLVEDTLAGYVVTVTSGTDSGSLAYGLAATGVPYIAFSTGTDGHVVDMGNAVTANEVVTVVGNGYTNTTITGNITCTNKTTLANLGLQDVTVAGGTLTLGDAFIPSGSTVAVSGGGLVVEKVTGAGSDSVIDLGATRLTVPRNAITSASGCTITNGLGAGGTAQGGAFRVSSGSLYLDNTSIIGNSSGDAAGGVYITYGTVNMSNSVISGNVAAAAFLGNDVRVDAGGKVYMNGGCNINQTVLSSDGRIVFSVSNTVGYIAARGEMNYGSVTLTSGAILDLTGNTNATPVAPGGGIVFESGGATVLTGATAGVVDAQYSMDNVTLPAGAKLTNTAVVDLGSARIEVGSNASTYASGCTLTNGYNGAFITLQNGATVQFNDCVFSGNYGKTAATLNCYAINNTAYVTGCTFTNNFNEVNAEACVVGGRYGGVLHLSSCTISGNTLYNSAAVGAMFNGSWVELKDCFIEGDVVLINNVSGKTSAVLVGSNTLDGIREGLNGTNCTAVISSGAVVNLTGNTNPTPIAPGAGITFESGGATILTGATAGVVEHTATISGATVASIGNDGSVKFPENTRLNMQASFTSATINANGVGNTVENGFSIVLIDSILNSTIVLADGYGSGEVTIGGTTFSLTKAITASGSISAWNSKIIVEDGVAITMTAGYSLSATTLIVGDGVTVNGVAVTGGTYAPNYRLKSDGTIEQRTS